jgi:NitT/TauT family transport system substrate-binding protein
MKKINLVALIITIIFSGFFIFYFKTGFKKQSLLLNNAQKKPLSSELPLTTVKLAMGYVPNIQFTPFYVALDQGYFKKQGLDIDFNYGMETDILALLAKGDLDFAIASGEQVILAQAQDLPLVNFFNWYQKFPVVITSLLSSQINSPRDLIGKSIGTPALQGASFIGLQAVLKENNINEDQISLKVIGYTQKESLTEAKVEAAVCYALNEPIQLELEGFKVNNIYVSDYINFVSNGLITNQEKIKNSPAQAKAFTQAFKQGLEFTINNQNAAFDIAKKYIPEMENEQGQKAVLEKSVEYWQADNLGFHNQNQWQQSVDFLFNIGLLEKKLNPQNLYTNQFIE